MTDEMGIQCGNFRNACEFSNSALKFFTCNRGPVIILNFKCGKKDATQKSIGNLRDLLRGAPFENLHGPIQGIQPLAKFKKQT